MEPKKIESEGATGGRIITFYSYKGGVGRSMALANVACMLPKHLANPAQRILMMDWDLEAPGLHRFFPTQLEQPHNKYRPGVIDYFRKLQEKLDKDASLYEELIAAEGWETLDSILPLDDYVCRDVVVGGVDCIKAGTLDARYADLVTTFNWHAFYNKYEAAIETLKTLLSQKYAYILIDSRTGFTDVSGICTMLLPEKLVTVFAPNRQSLDGVLDLASRATDFRLESNDFRPLSIFPLPSRIDNAELNLRREWRQQYQSDFEGRFRQIYDLDECTLTQYFDEVQLPYVSYYAYGEKVAVLEERSDNLSLRRAYEGFFERLVSLDFAWETATEDGTITAVEPTRVQPSEKYDVFLSYAPGDYEAVQKLAFTLRDYGIRVFLDKWSLVPGEPWALALENALNASAAVAVFIGPKGFTANEPFGFERPLPTGSSKRIVPVLLPGASAASLPRSLASLVFVDFAKGLDDPEARRKLLSGVTGRKIPELRPSGYESELGNIERRTEAEIAHLRLILDGLIRGYTIPILGAEVNLADRPPETFWQQASSYPIGRELSESLSLRFQFPLQSTVEGGPEDITRVAEYVSAKFGQGVLYRELHEIFAAEYPTSSVHQFFARLPRALRAKGYPPQPRIIITTNFDDLLERAFAAEGEPVHVVRYLAHGDVAQEIGKFAHKSPDGAERVIYEPNMYQVSSEPCTVILKVNGAVNRLNPQQDSYVITEDDYLSYLTHLGTGTVIPPDLLSQMLHGNYLFLGHRIDRWYLRAVVRILTGTRVLRAKSWSIQSNPSPMEMVLCQEHYIEVIDSRLRDYIAGLSEQLEYLPPRGFGDV